MSLTPMTLRLEAADSSIREEYRIDDGGVEVRWCESPMAEDSDWHRLDSQELSEHVKRNTVVAQWLEHRLGRRRLLRACTDQGQYLRTGEDRPVQRAA